MRSLEDLAVSAAAQRMLDTRQAGDLLQLRSWRSSRGADLPQSLRARILDTLSFAFDLEQRGGTGLVLGSQVAFWMEALAQLIETAPWAPQPLLLRVEHLRNPLNYRVLCNVATKALVAIHIEGPAVCDGLMHAIPKLPSLVSVTLDCGEFARGVSDVGISSLADSPTITNLTNLALTRSYISETGVNSLRRLTSLVCLNLSGSSKLSDLGIKSLTKLRKLKCMLLLDTARITQRGLVECALALSPGACVYWSGDSKSASTASECLEMHAVDTCAPTPQPNAATRRDAHAALSAAADATTDAARCVRPTIELCVSATPGKGLANLSVRTLEAATPATTPATRALDPQSRRSIARMLRLLSAPVSELAQKRSIQDDRWGGGGRRGGMLQGEGDHHEDASRVTVARMRSLAGGGGGSARGAAVLAGRFGTLTNMALLARGPAKKKLKTNT